MRSRWIQPTRATSLYAARNWTRLSMPQSDSFTPQSTRVKPGKQRLKTGAASGSLSNRAHLARIIEPTSYRRHPELLQGRLNTNVELRGCMFQLIQARIGQKKPKRGGLIIRRQR